MSNFRIVFAWLFTLFAIILTYFLVGLIVPIITYNLFDMYVTPPEAAKKIHEVVIIDSFTPFLQGLLTVAAGWGVAPAYNKVVVITITSIYFLWGLYYIHVDEDLSIFRVIFIAFSDFAGAFMGCFFSFQREFEK